MAGTAADARAPELTVYSRPGCHLCEEMIEGLRGLSREFSFTIAVVDVDRDPVLAARFDTEVPVLAHGARELCRYRLDVERVAEYLAGAGSAARTRTGC
jgi:hypothetical protein